ncbi:MAG: O-antigen ligase family protein [Actinomycetota bacterium]
MMVLRRRLLVALIVGTPLIFLPGVTLDAFNVPKLTLLAMGIGVCLCLLAVEWATTRQVVTGQGALVPAALLVAPLIVSWALSDYRSWSLLGTHGRFAGLLPYVLVAALGVLVGMSFRGATREIVVALAISGTLVAGYLTVQALGLDVYWRPGDGGYPPSTVGHFNFSGGFIALCLPAAIWLWSAATTPRRFLWIGATVVQVGGIILSFSQGAWAAALAGAIVAGTYATGTGRARTRRIATWIAVGAIASVVVGSVALSGIFDVDAGATARTRAVIWESALAMAGESPVVGRGPDSYALEGDSHRTLEEGLTIEAGRSDDPHSVPLAMLGNAGALGLLGFVAMLTWVFRRGIRVATVDPAAIAFLGVVVAYLVQCLVTIDVPTLRVGLWSAIGGVAAAGATSDKRPTRSRWLLALVAIAVGLPLLVAPVRWFLTPDVTMLRATRSLREGEPLQAIGQAQDAIDRRDDPAYRVRLIDAYGGAALEARDDGERFINQVDDVAAYLGTLPDATGHRVAGIAYHHWGYFDPNVDDDALAHFEDALRLDPADTDSRIGAAETLIHMGRPGDAVALLEPAMSVSDGRYADLWGAYSIALLKSGDVGGAREAARAATAIDVSCRQYLAIELLRITTAPDARPADPSFFATLTFRCTLGEAYVFARMVPDSFREEYVPAP